jgi:Protein of unknown function (DUF3429)
MTTSEPVQTSDAPPKAAFILGGLGLLPFLGLALLSHLGGEPTLTHLASRALVAYGSVILSFLGGIRWGLALAPTTTQVGLRLSQSIIPSLIGATAVLLPTLAATLLLSLSLLTLLWLDMRLARSHAAPSWYPKLRWPLTLGACVALLSLWL